MESWQLDKMYALVWILQCHKVTMKAAGVSITLSNAGSPPRKVRGYLLLQLWGGCAKNIWFTPSGCLENFHNCRVSLLFCLGKFGRVHPVIWWWGRSTRSWKQHEADQSQQDVFRRLLLTFGPTALNYVHGKEKPSCMKSVEWLFTIVSLTGRKISSRRILRANHDKWAQLLQTRLSSRS